MWLIKSKFSLFILLIIFISLVALAFLGYKNFQLQKQPVTLDATDQGKIFCGGIAGVECPSGLTCKLENRYPDAGGTCVVAQERGEGVLEATVMRSPTCPGPVTEKDNCEALVTNENFYIINLSGKEVMERKLVKTDKDGKFSISLIAGTYKVQSTDSGIGKEVGNPNFTITADKITTQKFYIDTGIR